MTLLTLTNVTKRYRTDTLETLALNSVSLSVEAGDFIAIMGPSGGGKSTLLSILGMLDTPTSGEYSFMDKRVERFSETKLTTLRHRHIGFIFQNFNLIDDLSILANVELPLKYAKQKKEERNRKAIKALESIGIGHRKDHFPWQLSGGEQQRAAIARAISMEPEIILADEPTGNLDSKNGQVIISLLQNLNAAGTTIIMVTHSEEVASSAKFVLRLRDGSIEVQDKEDF